MRVEVLFCFVFLLGGGGWCLTVMWTGKEGAVTEFMCVQDSGRLAVYSRDPDDPWRGGDGWKSDADAAM